MTHKNQLTCAELKTKQRVFYKGFPQTMRLCVHRAISWISAVEACGADADVRSIFL